MSNRTTHMNGQGIPTIHDLMTFCIEERGSDIHLCVGSPPRIRLNTELFVVEGTSVLTHEDITGMMDAITGDANKEEYKKTGSTDFAIEYREKETRFRVALFKEQGNCSMVLRRIPNKLLSLEDIGLPDAVPDLCNRPRGLFLVTGPTGSGKTTTLASMINFINENYGKNIITVEDPVEYHHKNKRSLVRQREVGIDVPDFPEALRRALRQDPNVILVGEMRDLETIRVAVTAAETGHLVLGTLHTSGAASTVNRIIDVFPANEQEHVRVQIASSLIAVLCQTLCPRCDRDGVVAAYEFMQVTPAISHMIRTNKPFGINDSIQTGAKAHGMQTMTDHLLLLFRSGLISEEVALAKAPDPIAMRMKLSALS